jgi:alpha-glucosidase
MGLDEVVLFLRPGHLLPLAERALCVDQLRDDRLDVLGFGKEEIHYLLYRDDELASDLDNPDDYVRITWRP